MGAAVGGTCVLTEPRAPSLFRVGGLRLRALSLVPAGQGPALPSSSAIRGAPHSHDKGNSWGA